MHRLVLPHLDGLGKGEQQKSFLGKETLSCALQINSSFVDEEGKEDSYAMGAAEVKTRGPERTRSIQRTSSSSLGLDNKR